MQLKFGLAVKILFKNLFALFAFLRYSPTIKFYYFALVVTC